ncbi:MAG: AAA family ATPase, partial [Anaerolineae bacterium]|nr:AAA family ATPase [Anaerolineae bacterium]
MLHVNPDLDRKYLEAYLTWLDVLLERQVKVWQLSGQNASDRFRGLYVNDAEAINLTQREPGTHWGSHISLSHEEETILDEKLRQARERVGKIEKQALEQAIDLKLNVLVSTFNLDEFEKWTLLICLAPALDIRYERIYGYLQDDVTLVNGSVDLILTLLLPENPDRLDYFERFNPDAALQKYNLLIPGGDAGHKPVNFLRRTYFVDNGVVSWLVGEYTPSISTEGVLDLYPVDLEESAEDIESVFEKKLMPNADVLTSIKPLLSFFGDDTLQQEMTARRLAVALEMPMLKINLVFEENAETALEKLTLVVRDARMLKALLFIQGCDIFINRDGCLLPQVFFKLKLLDDLVLLSSRNPFRFMDDMPGNDYPIMRVPFDSLSSNDRLSLWAGLLEDAADEVAEADLEVLSGQFTLTSGQVMSAASMALSIALQNGRQLQTGDLFEAARFHSGHHLVELAQKIHPRYHWGDLVLPETPVNMLRELVSMVKARSRVLEEWGLGKKLTASFGVSALFTGQSGTGKTLAAQIIANELGIDLYRIDLSTVVSKYIGETEKNLERIFNEAQTSNAILFFDEADSIFGKRSEVKDAHDRYANIEVGYLLQRMEGYDGIAILATNLRANLDEAFTRRLQFIINFPFPDEEYRKQIWEVLIPPSLPREDNLDLGIMAKRFKLAGGNIRNIIVSAAYLAANDGGRLTMKHLMHGARREFQKMGRLINE